MAGQLTDFGENKIADKARGQTITYPANWYVQLCSAAAEGSVTPLVISGLSRVTVPRSLAKWAGTQAPGSTLASAGTSHASSNNDAITFGTPAAGGTATHVALYDAASGGNAWAYFPITPIVITIGSPDPVVIAAGALQFVWGLTNGATDYLANKVIDEFFRGQAWTWPTPEYIGLFAAAPTNAGGGTEAAVSGYARAALTPSLVSLSGTQAAASTTASSGSSGRISNNAAINFPPMAADLTPVAVGIFDAATAGNLILWKAITPKTLTAGGPVGSFAANTLGITFD